MFTKMRNYPQQPGMFPNQNLMHQTPNFAYQNMYQQWGYPISRLPYHQLNRRLQAPAQYRVLEEAYRQKMQQINKLPYDNYSGQQQQQRGPQDQQKPPQQIPQAAQLPFDQMEQSAEQFARQQEQQQKQQQGSGSGSGSSSSSGSGSGSGSGSSQGQSQKKKKKSNKSEAMISFDKLSVGTVSSSSGVFNGKNIQFGWSSHSKTNTGFGTLGGSSNRVNRNINVVFDNDQVDTPIDDRDTMWSPVPTSN